MRIDALVLYQKVSYTNFCEYKASASTRVLIGVDGWGHISLAGAFVLVILPVSSRLKGDERVFGSLHGKHQWM